MKRFSPGNPAAFRPMEFPRLSPPELRAAVFKQPAWPALPPPDKATRVLAGLVAFTVLL